MEIWGPSKGSRADLTPSSAKKLNMSSDFPEIEAAISGICSRLAIEIDHNLQLEYQNGKHPTLLSYEKVEKPELTIPAIQKYLIGAQTILNQPCTFYDINRACRHYHFIQFLNNAIEENIKNVPNYEERLEKLLKETDYDPFESILYELAVSRAYSINPAVKNLTFINSTSETSPELEFTYNGKNIYIECKKFDRKANIASAIRDEVRNKAQLTLHGFKKINQSALIEVSFHEEPKLILESHIHDICLEAFNTKSTVRDSQLTVTVKELPKQLLNDYTLFPSPMYYWRRYGYKNQGEWFGLTSLVSAKYAYCHEIQEPSDCCASTWVDDLDFECVFKWKITNENLLWRYRKLGYNLLFKGFSQLKAYGDNSILHAWYERDGFAGHRQTELLDFYSRICKNNQDVFSWIIFNETILDTSINGIFDLIEHSHPIPGPTSTSIPPVVSTVLINDHEIFDGIAEFGIGQTPPDIDDCKRLTKCTAELADPRKKEDGSL